MFIRNPSSITKKTIRCSQEIYEYLIKNNFIPLSKENDEWIFLNKDGIEEHIKNFKGGG